MNMKIHAAFALAAAFALCGCVTEKSPIELRIALRPEAFETLDADQQERTRLGHIQIGDSTNMLWMAFGEPTTIATGETDSDKTNPDIETWTYVREPPPWTVGPPPPTAGFQPGAMFAPSPPPPPERVRKIYILTDGVITDMDTQREQVGD